MTLKLSKVFLVIAISVTAFLLGCSGTSQTSQTPLEAAAESCDLRSGVDAVGNFYGSKSTSDSGYGDWTELDKMEPEWICLIKTLAGNSVVTSLLAEKGEDFRTITTNGYTFSFSWLGWTTQRSELYIVSS